MTALILPRNTPVEIFDGMWMNLSSSLRKQFEFDGPVSTISIQGYLVGGDPLNPPSYQILESLDGSHWSSLGNDIWTTKNDYTTLNLGRFQFQILNNPYNGGALWYCTVKGVE